MARVQKKYIGWLHIINGDGTISVLYVSAHVWSDGKVEFYTVSEGEQ